MVPTTEVCVLGVDPNPFPIVFPIEDSFELVDVWLEKGVYKLRVL
mgnify:CR=1 FL=1